MLGVGYAGTGNVEDPPVGGEMNAELAIITAKRITKRTLLILGPLCAITFVGSLDERELNGISANYASSIVDESPQ